MSGSSKELFRQGNKKIAEKYSWFILDNRSASRWSFLSNEHCTHYENIKQHNASSEDWCIPADMHEHDYLIVEPACEVILAGHTRQERRKWGSEWLWSVIGLRINWAIEVDDETLIYAEED